MVPLKEFQCYIFFDPKTVDQEDPITQVIRPGHPPVFRLGAVATTCQGAQGVGIPGSHGERFSWSGPPERAFASLLPAHTAVLSEAPVPELWRECCGLGMWFSMCFFTIFPTSY